MRVSLVLAALLAVAAPGRAADSRDRSFSLDLGEAWLFADASRFQGQVLLAATFRKHPEDTLLITRLVLDPGVSLKSFAESKFGAFKAKVKFGPGPGALKAVELRKGLPPAFTFRAGDVMHRFEVVYFAFDGSTYSAVCPGNLAEECRAVLGTIGPPRRLARQKAGVGPFTLAVPAGWAVSKNTPADLEFVREPGQSILLRSVDIPKALAGAPSLEGDLQRSLTGVVPGLAASKLRHFAFGRKAGEAAWVVADRGEKGWLLSGVVWAQGRSYRLAVIARSPAEPLAKAALDSWQAAP